MRTKTSDPLRSQVSFPARCVMGLFKPTFFKRDAPSQRGLQASRPPLRLVGCWKQKSVVEATHLPSRAGFKQVHTARAGLYKIHLDLGRGISRGLRLSKKWHSHFFEGDCTKASSRFLAKLSAKLSREVSFPRYTPPEMTILHFIPSPSGNGTPCRRAFLTSWGRGISRGLFLFPRPMNKM